jgi:hypothetical protein
MLALLALVCFLAAAIIAGLERAWVLVLIAVGLALMMWPTVAAGL